MRNKKRILILLAAAAICSSCANGNVVSSSVDATPLSSSETVAAVVSEAASQTAETSSASTSESLTASETVSETSAAETTTSLPKTAEASVSETTASSEETTSASAGTTTTSQTTATSETTTTAETTSVSVTEEITTAAETEVISETSVPAAQKPPAEIKALEVSSPGALKEDTGTAVLDYSNASLGYISAAYSGESARAKLRITCGDITCDHDLSVTGEAEYFPLMQGSGDYRIQIYEQLDGKVYSCALDLSVSLTVEDEVRMYLYPNRYSMFDKSSDCVVLSSEICAGCEGDIEKIGAIFTYITDNITYDYELAATVQSGYIPDPDSVLKKRSGICFDYASLFAAMSRSQGIPARLVIGYAAPDIYHAWNEVYTEETGWITPELLLSKKGYNLVDATFYAGTDNKEAIAEYISDSGNYSSVYRY